jgi:predicted nucleic acid-binding protein
VIEVLDKAGGLHSVLLPFMTLMELEYGLLRALPRAEAENAVRLVEAWPAEIVESSPAWRHAAAEVKSHGGLSLGDAWIAALALLRGATLLHHDPEFDSVEGLIALPLR